MNRASTFLGAFGFIIFGVNVAQAACVQTDPNTFLEASRATVDKNNVYVYFPYPESMFLPEKIEGQDLQWMGISWGASSGALFLLDCDGKTLAHLNLGTIKELKMGPTVPTGQTIALKYVSGYGTGLHTISTALIRYENNVIRTLWQHEANSIISFPSLGDDYEDTFAWTISPDGKRITIKGQRKVDTVEHDHGWAPGTIHDLPLKSYCWKVADREFSKCDPKP